MAQSKLEQGQETELTPIQYTEKIGPLTALVLRWPAWMDVLRNEMQGGTLNPRYPNEFASHTRGLLITDARNLFD